MRGRTGGRHRIRLHADEVVLFVDKDAKDDRAERHVACANRLEDADDRNVFADVLEHLSIKNVSTRLPLSSSYLELFPVGVHTTGFVAVGENAPRLVDKLPKDTVAHQLVRRKAHGAIPVFPKVGRPPHRRRIHRFYNPPFYADVSWE